MSLARLHPRLQDFVKDKKWDDLTPIQKEAFDPIFRGESCIIEAPTSGGKTEAVLFPLLTRIKPSKTEGVRVLYIAPLKALLNDLELRVVPYAKMCYMEAFKWHGDVSQSEKIQQMLFPSEILLTTPESIEAILLRKSMWVDVFRNLETIVIDEAHYFALTERGAHLIALLERIEAGIKSSPQRIAISATVGNPKELLSWLMSGKEGGVPIKEKAIAEKEKDFIIHYVDETCELLHEKLYNLLLNKKTIVFERSRTGTENTATKLNERSIYGRIPLEVKTHHSSVSKRLREEAETSIKSDAESSIDAIISTSTLELGIDIGSLDQVVQIDGLSSSGSFLQRVGRTGRRKGQAQFFRGLCSDVDEMVLLTGCVSLGLRHVSEAILFPQRAFHILAHQVICICIQTHGATANQIWDILSKASCFSKISRNEFDGLIDYMQQEDYLRKVGLNILVTSNKTEDNFLRANYKRLFAIFDTGPMYNVVNGKKIIGTLDCGFARMQELPFVFVLGGIEWNALKLDHELQQVVVEKNTTGIAPKWSAIGGFDVPYELAQEVGWLLMNDLIPEFLDVLARNELLKQRNTYRNLGWSSDKWIIESSSETPDLLYVWTFAGDKINRTLTKLLFREASVKISYDYKGLVINSKKGKSFEDLYEIIISFKDRSEYELGALISEVIKASWFSKFSECLPDSLAKSTICEKSLDIPGLLRELNRVAFVDLNEGESEF